MALVTENGVPPGPMSGEIDAGNSTTTPLSGGATFTGAATDVSAFASIGVSYNADVAGAADGLTMEFSPDGTNWDRKIVVTAEANNLQTAFGGVHMLSVINQYFRVVYVNGAGAQANFRLQTTVHTDRSLPLVSRSDQVINKHNDVQLVRVIGDYDLDKARSLFSYMAGDAIEATKDDVSTTETTIWQKAGDVSYTFPTTAETVRIQAGGNAADDSDGGAGARTVAVHGLDENWAEVDETLTLEGADASSASTTTFIRINHAEVVTSGAYGATNTGPIIIETTSTNDELAIIGAGRGHAENAVFSVPAGKTMFITRFTANVGASNKATLRVYVRESADATSAPFGAPYVFAQFNEIDTVVSSRPHTLRPIPAMSDFYVTAQKDSGGGDAHASMVVDFDCVEVAP